MNLRSKTASLVAMTVALSLITPAAVWAAGDYRYRGDHRGHGEQRYPDRHHDRHQRRHHNDDSDDGAALLAGLLFGGLLAYAISNADDAGASDRELPPVDDDEPLPWHTSARQRHMDGSVCLQEREYQTTVIVGGREQQAYGTACLQPDGSWRRGPARVDAF